jgi:hypothetical protein
MKAAGLSESSVGSYQVHGLRCHQTVLVIKADDNDDGGSSAVYNISIQYLDWRSYDFFFLEPEATNKK